MNATSASPADPVNPPDPAKKVLVWDAPVRVFHWLMVLCFAGAYLTAESEVWRLVHVSLGYTMVGLVVFRLMWGLIGTRYARFTSFVRGPKTVWQYVRALIQRQPAHHIGHNPIGALSIVVVLVLTAALGATGWATYNDLAGDWVAGVHEVIANSLVLIICVHIAGVVMASAMHRENLVRAMVTGRKAGSAQDGIRAAWWSVAAVMVAAVLGFWWLQWHSVVL